MLRDVEGLSAPEVAKVLGISVDAVKSRLHRARVVVRQALVPVLGSPVIETPPGSMCPDVLTLFSKHLEGEIDPSVCATMEAHLAHCSHCRNACESLKRTLAMCRQLPTPDVPEEGLSAPAPFELAPQAEARTASRATPSMGATRE